MFGFGAHADAAVAARRAVAEMNQFLGAAAHAAPDGSGYRTAEPEVLDWFHRATVASDPHLLPDPALPLRDPVEMSLPVTDDLAQDVAACRLRFERAGLEVLVLDMTRPDVGLPVVKVVVPGMRHMWARFAPGRLYDVPVATGALAAPVAEPDLNPVPLFV